MKKYAFVFFVLFLCSCARKVVTVERVVNDTVTVERVVNVVDTRRDTVTVERIINQETERVELDTAGRVRVVTRTVYRDTGSTRAGSVVEKIVHDTIQVEATHHDTTVTTTPQKRDTKFIYILVIAFLVSAIGGVIYIKIK